MQRKLKNIMSVIFLLMILIIPQVFWGDCAVTSITRIDQTPINKSIITFKVAFSEIVTGVDNTDFSLTTTGSISDTTVTLIKYYGSRQDYRIFVNTGTGEGTIRLNLIDDDSIENLSGDKLGGTGAGNGDFMSGESYTIEKTPPVISGGITLDKPSPTNLDGVSFSVNFSESVEKTFTSSDITPLGTLSSGATVAVDTLTTQSFRITAIPTNINVTGTIGVSITGSVKDKAGNALSVPVNSSLYTIRNYPGDKNNDGKVSSDELNEVILKNRNLVK